MIARTAISIESNGSTLSKLSLRHEESNRNRTPLRNWSFFVCWLKCNYVCTPYRCVRLISLINKFVISFFAHGKTCLFGLNVTELREYSPVTGYGHSHLDSYSLLSSSTLNVIVFCLPFICFLLLLSSTILCVVCVCVNNGRTNYKEKKDAVKIEHGIRYRFSRARNLVYITLLACAHG